MGKFKGFLKRTLGGLALATCWLPAVAGLGGFLGFLGSGIAALVYDGARSSYTDTAIYQQEYVKDADEAAALHVSGEFSDEEYYNRLQYLNSDDYRDEVLARPLEENKAVQESLLKRDYAVKWVIGLGSTAGAGLVASLFWYVGELAEIFDDAATDLFYEARNEAEEEKRKKLEKERQEREEREKKEKPKDEFEESEAEEVLPNIEDKYYSE